MDVLVAAARVRSAHRVAVQDLEAVLLSGIDWWSPSSQQPVGFRPIGFRAAWLYLERERILARWHRGKTDKMTTVRELMGLLPS